MGDVGGVEIGVGVEPEAVEAEGVDSPSGFSLDLWRSQYELVLVA